MNRVTRRTFGIGSLRLLLALSLVQHATRAGAVGGSLKSTVRPWLARLEEVCAAVSSARIAPSQWQHEMETLFGRVDMPDFLAAIDFETLAARATVSLI